MKKAVIKFGMVEISDQAERVVDTDIPCSSILVAAPASNGASIFVGAANVDNSGNGFELEPGARIPIPFTDTSRLYVIGEIGDTLSYMVLS
jgi:hypothetical protein